MYTNLNKVLSYAEKEEICIGAFNMHTLDMLPSMIRAAKDLGRPIIIQTSVGIAETVGYGVIAAVCKHMAEKEQVEVVLHLDHAKEMKDIKKAIDEGYSSVMFDGSLLPIEDNIRITKEVIDYARPRGVSVEAELGAIGGTEDGETVSEDQKSYTKVSDAEYFVSETDVDALAVSIGTTHGQFKSKTELDFELLASISESVNCPLVLHGGTGVKEEDITKLKKLGIRKFNVGTELLVAWNTKAKEKFSKTKVNESLRNNTIPCNQEVYKVIQNKIEHFSE